MIDFGHIENTRKHRKDIYKYYLNVQEAIRQNNKPKTRMRIGKMGRIYVFKFWIRLLL